MTLLLAQCSLQTPEEFGSLRSVYLINCVNNFINTETSIYTLLLAQWRLIAVKLDVKLHRTRITISVPSVQDPYLSIFFLNVIGTWTRFLQFLWQHEAVNICQIWKYLYAMKMYYFNCSDQNIILMTLTSLKIHLIIMWHYGPLSATQTGFLYYAYRWQDDTIFWRCRSLPNTIYKKIF